MKSSPLRLSAVILIGSAVSGFVAYAENGGDRTPFPIGIPLDQHARAIELPLPPYPLEEKEEARKGVVSVLVKIDEAGVAEVVQVMSSASYRFGDAARKAAAGWKFKAARKDGKKSADLLEFLLYFDPAKDVEIVGPLYE